MSKSGVDVNATKEDGVSTHNQTGNHCSNAAFDRLIERGAKRNFEFIDRSIFHETAFIRKTHVKKNILQKFNIEYSDRSNCSPFVHAFYIVF